MRSSLKEVVISATEDVYALVHEKTGSFGLCFKYIPPCMLCSICIIDLPLRQSLVMTPKSCSYTRFATTDLMEYASCVHAMRAPIDILSILQASLA